MSHDPAVRAPTWRPAVFAALLMACTLSDKASAPASPAMCGTTADEVGTWSGNPFKPHDLTEASRCAEAAFAWRTLLYLTAPSANGPPKFTLWRDLSRLFPADGDPIPWDAERIYTPLNAAPREGGARDRHGRPVHYTRRLNQEAYDHVAACDLHRTACVQPGVRFPDGSMALHLAWYVVEDCTLPDSPASCTPDDASDYLTLRGQIPGPDGSPRDATLALIGVHVAHKTAHHPDWIWSSFAHSRNTTDGLLTGTGQPPSPSPEIAASNTLVQRGLASAGPHHATLQHYALLGVSTARTPAEQALWNPAFEADPPRSTCQDCHQAPLAHDRLRVLALAQHPGPCDEQAAQCQAAATPDPVGDGPSTPRPPATAP